MVAYLLSTRCFCCNSALNILMAAGNPAVMMQQYRKNNLNFLFALLFNAHQYHQCDLNPLCVGLKHLQVDAI